MSNPHSSNTVVNAAAALANGGKLIIFSGAQASNADGAAGTPLATLSLSATAFSSVSGGIMTMGTITPATASATGTAAWFRITEANGTTGLWDGDVNTTGASLNLSTTAISSGATVSVTSLTITYAL